MSDKGTLFRLDVRGNMAAILRDIDGVRKRDVQLAARYALDRAAAACRTQAKREVADRSGITVRQAEKRIHTGKARLNQMDVPIYLEHRRVNAAHMEPKQRQMGVVTALRGARRFNFPGAFLLEPGHTSKRGQEFPDGIVFVRLKRAQASWGTMPKRGRLKRQYGEPDLPVMAIKIAHYPTSERIVERIVDKVGPAAFEKNFQHDLERRLTRATR